MSLLNVFKDRPTKTTLTLLSLILGVVTLVMFQTLQVATYQEAFEFLSSEQDRIPLLFTWFFNLMSFAILGIIGINWIRDFTRESYHYEDLLINNLVCILTGILLITFSLTFLFFIMSKLQGLVLIVLIVLVLFNSDSGSSKKDKKIKRGSKSNRMIASFLLACNTSVHSVSE